LEKWAQKAYEINLKAEALKVWRSKMWQHSKMLKQAKQARRYLLKRSAWETWKRKAEEKKRERKLQAFLIKRQGQILQLWSAKAKVQRNLRRKGEVVMMAAQTVSCKAGYLLPPSNPFHYKLTDVYREF
jgi:hypothetical protein